MTKLSLRKPCRIFRNLHDEDLIQEVGGLEEAKEALHGLIEDKQISDIITGMREDVGDINDKIAELGEKLETADDYKEILNEIYELRSEKEGILDEYCEKLEKYEMNDDIKEAFEEIEAERIDYDPPTRD